MVIAEGEKTYLWDCEGGHSTHGLLHGLCLYIKMLKLTFKLVHDVGNLEERGRKMSCVSNQTKAQRGTSHDLAQLLAMRSGLAFSKFMDLRAESIDFTTPAIELVTCRHWGMQTETAHTTGSHCDPV